MSSALLTGDAARCPRAGSAGGGGAITTLANEPAWRPAGPAADYCRWQRGAERGWCPPRLVPVPGQPCWLLPQNPPPVRQWAPGCRVGPCLQMLSWWHCHPGLSLEEGTVLVSPMSPVEGGCWRGWVLPEGDGAGPAAGRGKGRRQLPWKQNKINASCWQVWREVGPGQGRAPASPGGETLEPPAWPPPWPRHPAQVVPWGRFGPDQKQKPAEPGARSSGRGLRGSVEAGPWRRVSARPLRSRPQGGTSCPAPAPASDQHLSQDRHCLLVHPAMEPPVRPSVHPSAIPLSVPVAVPRALAPAAVAEASLISRSPDECGSSPGTGFISRRRT